MAGYWLKLYTEILEDPKYNRMSDNTKIGMYELLLVAKRFGDDGSLPPIEDVAFYTRRTVEWWQVVYDELRSIEFLVSNGHDVIIRKFSERQAPTDAKTRAKMSREIAHRNEFKAKETAYETHADECETHGETETDTDREAETDTESGASAAPDVLEEFASVTGHHPRKEQTDKVITAMQAIQRTDRRFVLQKCWDEWSSRGYNPYGLAWLTEWAITGIPASKHTTTAPKADKDDYYRFTAGKFGHIGEH